MRKFNISSFVCLLLLGMGTQLSAQHLQRGWQAGASLPLAFDGLKDWTNQSFMGLCLDGSYQMPFPGTDIAFVRYGMGFNWFPGKKKDVGYPYDERTISLMGLQANLDLLFQVGDTPFAIVTGLSINTWMKDVESSFFHNNHTVNNSTSGTVKNAFGKLGFRFGAEYAINEKFTVQATIQLTELGTDREWVNEDYLGSWRETIGDHRVNPSWMQLGVRYKF